MWSFRLRKRRADGHALAQQIVDIFQAGALERDAAGYRGVYRPDHADVIERLSKFPGSGIAVENHVGGGDGYVHFSVSDILHILERSCGGLGIALYPLNVVGPYLRQSRAGRIKRTAGIAGTEGHDNVPARGGAFGCRGAVARCRRS